VSSSFYMGLWITRLEILQLKITRESITCRVIQVGQPKAFNGAKDRRMARANGLANFRRQIEVLTHG
jgi:hypothetical protein